MTENNVPTTIAEIIVQKKGVYILFANCDFKLTNSAGSRKLMINNAATVEVQGSATGYTQLTTSHSFVCNAGQAFGLNCTQSSGGQISVDGEITAVLLKEL